jgi:phage terminase small subunit
MFNLTPKQAKFARSFFETGKASESYRASYDAEGMADSSVATASSDLLKHPEVMAYLADMASSAEWAAMLSVSWVLKQYMQIATADVNELVESRRTCCRHCYGIGHAYQWKDIDEWALALAKTMETNAARELTNSRATKPLPPEPLPSDAGGFGYWATKEPVETCTECFGVGHTEMYIHDTRKLKGAAKLLYAGLKPTASGVQVLTRNQDAALDYLAKYLGIDRKTLELTGPNGGPIKSISVATSDPAEAAKMYASLMAVEAK